MTTRLISTSDAAELAALLAANHDHLRPYEPARPADYETEAGQRKVIDDLLQKTDSLPHVIIDEGRIAGRITLNSIVRGPFQSASLGYWVGERAGGRGLASAAVGRILEIAFGELGLHRIEAATLVGNLRSQRVLEKNGFLRYGLAPRYLKIAGDWRDHILFQRLDSETVAAGG